MRFIGLRVDHPEYENKTQVYRAEIVLSSGEKLDLGLAKIDPDEHYNFAVFDQAVYAVRFRTKHLTHAYIYMTVI